MLTLIILCSIGVGNVWGDTNTPTSGSSYRFKATASGTSYYLVAPTSNGMGTVTTTEADGTIFTFTKEGSDWYITFVSSGNTYYMYESGSNGQVSISSKKTKVTTVTTNGNYAKIGGSKWIQFNGNANPKRMGCYSSSQTGVVLSPATSCDNKVTISKGSETNGTFTISPSGSQASCDGVAVMVTPTPASSAYYCSAVSASTGETGIDNGNGTWTVNIAANTTGTSTINVTFSLKTSYTVTWYNEGVSIRTESVYSGDKVSALPSPAPTSSCSGEFIGWVRSDADVADKSVTDAYTIHPTAPTLFADVAGSPTITGNTAFHAVYRMPKQD